jgi:hypothetical protein
METHALDMLISGVPWEWKKQAASNLQVRFVMFFLEDLCGIGWISNYMLDQTGWDGFSFRFPIRSRDQKRRQLDHF